MNEVRKRLLRSIAKHDGEWGWYQLDRVVNPRDLADGETMMDVLRSMEEDGLIIQQPSTPQNKFSITHAGRCILEEVDP